MCQLLNQSPMNSLIGSVNLLLLQTKLHGYQLYARATVTAEDKFLLTGDGVDCPSTGLFHFALLPRTYESLTNRVSFHSLEFLPI